MRERAALSQAELAAKAGVAKPTVIDLELGRSEARPSTVRKLADALGCQPVELMEE